MLLLVRSQRKSEKCIWELEGGRSLWCSGITTLLPAVMWKVENVPNEPSDLAQEISKQCWRCCLVPSHCLCKMREVLINKNKDLVNLKILSLSRWQAMLKLRNDVWAKIKPRALPGSSPVELQIRLQPPTPMTSCYRLWETLRQKHEAGLYPDSWLTETMR